MARTRTQLRQLVAKQLGLVFTTGTADAGGSTTSLKDTVLQAYLNDEIIGAWIYLTSGSPTFTELRVTDHVQSTGVATTTPTLGAAPDTLTYELLPFSPTQIHDALDDAVRKLYDQGWLVRQQWQRLVLGSPLFNADWSSWDSGTVATGWARNGTGTIARERNSAYAPPGLTSLKLSAVADYITLDPTWRSYLDDFRGDTVRFYCPVRTATASAARINLYTGANNYSPYHSGNDRWELLSVSVSTTTSTNELEPRLYNDTTAAVYFGMPFVLGRTLPELPFPITTMPEGPAEILFMSPDWLQDELISGRGIIRTQGHKHALSDYNFRRHYHENVASGGGAQVGVVDFSGARQLPLPGSHLLCIGDGPLTIVTADADSYEVTQSESMMLATQAAILLLERAMMRAPSSVTATYAQRVARLTRNLTQLVGGAGQERISAVHPLRW